MNDTKKKQEPSAKQVNANRINGAKSMGPKTEAGKVKSGQNAIKHGFFARAVVLPGEDITAFEALRDQLWNQLNPCNVLEEILAREIIETSWRLQRLGSIESEVFTRRGISFTGNECGSGFAFINDAQGLNTFTKLSHYEAILSRRFYKAFDGFRRLREKGFDPSSTEGNGTKREPELKESTPATNKNESDASDSASESNSCAGFTHAASEDGKTPVSDTHTANDAESPICSSVVQNNDDNEYRESNPRTG